MTARMQKGAAQMASPLDHVGLTARGGRRMCGEGRLAGSIYLECGLFLNGTPIEQYLKDPPERFRPEQFNVNARGVHVITTPDGISHVVDWVGAEHYEYPCDFIEEARRMGVSRRIARTADLSRIGPSSMMILIHPKGSMSNMEEVLADSEAVCRNTRHTRGQRCMAGYWVAPGDEHGKRSLADGSTYEITPRLTGDPVAKHVPAIFMAVPISAISVIRNHDGTLNEQAWQTAQGSGFQPVAADF